MHSEKKKLLDGAAFSGIVCVCMYMYVNKMMMMPVHPGAPWLHKFKGPGGDLKYSEWKEQIKDARCLATPQQAVSKLGSQELTETKKIDILLGVLTDDAKRQVSVLEGARQDCRQLRYSSI